MISSAAREHRTGCSVSEIWYLWVELASSVGKPRVEIGIVFHSLMSMKGCKSGLKKNTTSPPFFRMIVAR